MIFDKLQHLHRYSIAQKEQIEKFISQNNCLELPNEQIDINGKNLFVRVMEYAPQAAHEKEFETHQIYADLQYVVCGIELMQTAPLEALTPAKKYDPKGDYQFFKAQDERITDLIVHSGEFTVFYPGEAHRPGCLYKNHTGQVKKLVFKIKMN